MYDTIGLVTLILMAFAVSAVAGYCVPVDVLVVPVAALFAFTSLRGSMPGAPASFGTPQVFADERN